ncbi:MAG: ATP-binding cassette domain-containing protein [Ectothiorhodospiraceae bacterium]|nr:ATP-binding cassette domain-containing protein [Ectothiorhodospiraceae bacterium]
MSTSAITAAPALVEMRGLTRHYDSRRGLWGRLTGNPGVLVQAVNGVDLDIRRGETVGLIGESGCGKSTLGRVAIRLHEPTAGSVRFDGTDLATLSPLELKRLRRRLQIIFQDPYASLNPRKSVLELLATPLRLHALASGPELADRVGAMLQAVGLGPEHLRRYPHQFSGGQRQRIGIARALMLEPDFVVCDEPVSALDVSVQAQIIGLLGRLKRELGLTYLFISHDIAVIGHVSDRIAVMYLGEIVEEGPRDAVLGDPRHPYTQSLLASVPRIEGTPGGARRQRLQGDLPSPVAPPPGCKFHPRCPVAVARCAREAPATTAVRPGHRVRCHLVT